MTAPPPDRRASPTVIPLPRPPRGETCTRVAPSLPPAAPASEGEVGAGTALQRQEEGATGLSLHPEALDQLMPMCLVLTPDGRIAHTGPTLRKLLPAGAIGQQLAAIGNILRPAGAVTSDELLRAGGRVKLGLDPERATLRGQAVPLAQGGVLVNFTMGLSVVKEIEGRKLDPGDFAHTDLAVDLLYLVEAKSALLREGQRLNARLDEAKRTAEAQALTDPLTGLANRRAMELTMAQLLRTGTSFGLVQLDLDLFKQVNDQLGHAAGDHVLQVVAALLRGITRPNDTVVRSGGDEFLLLLPGISRSTQLRVVGERVIEDMQQPIDYRGYFCQVGVSIGATASAFYDRPEGDRMLSDADGALYVSKQSGSSTLTIWSPEIDTGE